ncbi:diacylglycerol kinase family protein [soil metagenome]
MNPFITSIKKCIHSFSYASSGLLFAFKNENNFNFHFLATIIVVILGFVFQLNLVEWIILVILIGLVYLSEIFNTAIEKLVDLIHPELQSKAGLVKDIAAGGVLIASIISAIGGLILFLGKLCFLK